MSDNKIATEASIKEFVESSDHRIKRELPEQLILLYYILQELKGLLTNTELRASALSVTGPITDTELRASDVGVSLKGFRSSDSTYQPLRLDKATNTIQVIDYEHHEIHAGSHFFYTDSVELASSGVQDYMITTPDTTKWAHLVFMATGSAITTVQVYEAGNRSGTTAQTILNSDRNNLTASTITLHKGTSGGTTDGTLIWQRKSGAATAQSRSGMEANRSEEIILKQNTKYIIRITSGTNSNLTNLQLGFYEHTNIA